MADENKRNLLYFEAPSMAQLFSLMQSWQVENEKRLHSVSVERDGDKFCCIGLTNPTEVIIRDGAGSGGVDVTSNALRVRIV
jgi:hypothetical protein